jgi:hypothetical protein
MLAVLLSVLEFAIGLVLATATLSYSIGLSSLTRDVNL